MTVNFIQPLSNAWNRMMTALFKPFDLGKWFVAGFTAFLAGLMDSPVRGWGSGFHKKGRFEVDEFFNFLEPAKEWIAEHPEWFTLIALGIIVAILLTILFIWISSRAKFMFLDNVLHNRGRVVKPWREFRDLGNSLFLWRLAFGVIVFLLSGSYVWYAFNTLRDMYYADAPDSSLISNAIILGAIFILLMLVIVYIILFLDHFVVPIMYKRRQKAMVAWGHFLALFSSYRLHFLGYGIFVLFLFIVFSALVVISGLMTCCLGFVLLVIPYISSVVTLPIAWIFRAFGVEFLEQFGSDFKLFPEEQEAPGIDPLQEG